MSIINRIYSNFRRRRYYIGFLDLEEIKLPISKRWDKIKWLEEGEYKGGWFADPFFLSVSDNRVELLVEEWLDVLNRGRLSHLDICRRNGGFYLEKITPILELDTHLSFPIIWREDGKIYVYPENYQSGSLIIYEYDQESKKLVNPICIIDEPLADTAIFKEDNKYYAFGIKITRDEYERRRAFVYCSDSLLKGWKEYQVINNDYCIERGAGQILNWHGRWIRPVQNCEGDYGEDTIFNELHKTDTGFLEEYVSRLEPMHNKRKGLSLHTFNVMDGLCVIDGNDYYHPHLAKVYRFIKQIFPK